MKKIGLVIIMIVLLATVANAASMWGTYKDKPIIRITVDSVPIKVLDAPAVLMDDRTMIPIYLLKEAGIKYSWDQKNQTVNIVSQKSVEVAVEPVPLPLPLPLPLPIPEEIKKLTIKEVYKLADAVGLVKVYDSFGNVACSGSGFMIYPNLFITNYHVAMCGGTGRITVKIAGMNYSNGYEAWYTFANQNYDLYGMVISTSFDSQGRATGNVPPTVYNIVNTNLPDIGDKVYTIGSPYGLENTVSEGFVSGIREMDGMTLIQHTADTESGSSGGVLMDEYGYVIGVTSSGYEGTNLDFAIPIKYVKEEIDKLY